MNASRLHNKIDRKKTVLELMCDFVFFCLFFFVLCVLYRFAKFYGLQDHLNERIGMPIYSVLKSNLITFFKTILTLEEFDETTILKTAAILDTNAFEVRTADGSSKIRAIYADTAMMSHDCVPNSYHSFDENMQIIVRAASKYYYINGMM